MAYDPTLPADHAPIVAAELRNQFNALQAQITALQQQVGPLAPIVSVDMNNMTFNVAWNGLPVAYWEIYYSGNPPGNYYDIGQTSPGELPTNYWNWIGDTNVNWALYVVGYNGDGNVITLQSNVLTGHSP